MAVVLEGPERPALSRGTVPAGEDDLVVDVEWSGVSTGNEKLYRSGRMPQFPGMGYPLVPGYESVGRIREAGGRATSARAGVRARRALLRQRSAACSAAPRVAWSMPGLQVMPVARPRRRVPCCWRSRPPRAMPSRCRGAAPPDLIIGHGVLGRCSRRLVAAGPPPVVWERNEAQPAAPVGYPVVDPDADPRRDYRAIYDVSGDAGRSSTR